VARQRVERRLPEAGDHGTLPLDRHHLREAALPQLGRGVVDLGSAKQSLVGCIRGGSC
jgi:hypothetical protein